MKSLSLLYFPLKSLHLRSILKRTTKSKHKHRFCLSFSFPWQNPARNSRLSVVPWKAAVHRDNNSRKVVNAICNMHEGANWKGEISDLYWRWFQRVNIFPSEKVRPMSRGWEWSWLYFQHFFLDLNVQVYLSFVTSSYHYPSPSGFV